MIGFGRILNKLPSAIQAILGHKSFIWDGVYQNMDKIPSGIKGFESREFITNTRELTKTLLANQRNRDKSDYLAVKGENALLPFALSLLSSKSGRSVKVLDFGGGMGIGYVLSGSASPHLKVEYHIVEQKEMCIEGAMLFEDGQPVFFHSELPPHSEIFDIVYINSALQYITGYRELLASLCEYQPAYLLFARISAGNVPTYVSIQKNVSDARIPYIFFNLDEIVEIMDGHGYSLVFKNAVDRHYDMSNLPKENQLPYQANLLFAKKNKSE